MLGRVLALNLHVIDEAPIDASSDDLALLFIEAGELDEAVFYWQLADHVQMLVQNEQLEVSAKRKVQVKPC